MNKVIVLLLAMMATACAGPNPNPGERTTDMGWTSGKHVQGWPAVHERAKEGQPWAQLRMGIFYVYGWGVEQNFEEALSGTQERLLKLQKVTGPTVF